MEPKSTAADISKGSGMSYYVKVGECVTVPLKLQVIKIFTRDDRIYYLGIPVDNPKRCVVLKDPLFMVCTEYDADATMPDMPMEMLEQAATWADEHVQIERTDDGGEQEQDDSDEG